jgi:Glycosyl hydrolase family 92
MSAWYIYSALGFYPVNPVAGVYVVGRYILCRLGEPWTNINYTFIAPSLIASLLTYLLPIGHYTSLPQVLTLNHMSSQ